jgi:hypothetical protein
MRAHLSLPVSVTRLPTRRSQEQEALLTVVDHLRRLDWDRIAVGIVAVMHLWLAVTLVLAPRVQVLTQGSRPAFDLMPPEWWAVWLAVGGIIAVALVLRVTAVRQVFAWLVVAPAQTVWLAASVLAVTQGGGSAIGVVLWSVLLAFTALTAIRLAIAYASGKR